VTQQSKILLGDCQSIASGHNSSVREERERIALEYADHVSATPVDVCDEFFANLQQHFSKHEIVELTAHIAHENFNAKSSRPLLVEANNFCEIPLQQPKAQAP
jgi:alkylhydroperoxidase family enzyme